MRFGAYHIYLPLLLKPAPRSLATQLWALKNEAQLQRASTICCSSPPAAAPRFRSSNETPKTLYRTAGYRVTGERAVRVDILERLADLIRPALSWREGTTPKPAGAFDGRSFTVTGAMTSLTGASGEDFASILRSLGYRMDRKPKPPEAANETKPPEAKAARSRPRRNPRTETAAPESAAIAGSRNAISASRACCRSCRSAAGRGCAPEVAPCCASTSSRVAAARTPISSRPASRRSRRLRRAAGPPQQPVAEPPAVIEAAIAPVVPNAAPPREAEAAALATAGQQPEMIEVWRPAGRWRCASRSTRGAAPAAPAVNRASRRRPHLPIRPRSRRRRSTRRAEAGAAAVADRAAAAKKRADEQGRQ